MAGLADYGAVDPTALKQKQFIDEISREEYGAHSSEVKKYYPAFKNWRTLLIPASPEERKAIIFHNLNLDVIADVEAIKTIEQAYSKIEGWIRSISKESLEDFFATAKPIHEAIVAYKSTTTNYGLAVTTLVGDIIFHDRKMLKARSCPERFWKDSRLELYAIPCEYTKHEGTGSHRKDCIQYIKSQTCEWQDTDYQVGVGRQTFQADLRHINQLKFQAIGKFVSKTLKEYDWEEVKRMLATINFDHPDIFLQDDLQELFEYTKEDRAFIKYFFSEYKNEVDAQGNVITSMRDKYEGEQIDIDSEFLEEDDFALPSDSEIEAIEDEDEPEL